MHLCAPVGCISTQCVCVLSEYGIKVWEGELQVPAAVNCASVAGLLCAEGAVLLAGVQHLTPSLGAFPSAVINSKGYSLPKLFQYHQLTVFLSHILCKHPDSPKYGLMWGRIHSLKGRGFKQGYSDKLGICVPLLPNYHANRRKGSWARQGCAEPCPCFQGRCEQFQPFCLFILPFWRSSRATCLSGVRLRFRCSALIFCEPLLSCSTHLL